MTLCPAALAIQESFQTEGTQLSTLHAAFIEIILFYQPDKLPLLYHCPSGVEDDIQVIVQVMQEARQDRNYEVADAARKLLTDSGCTVSNQKDRTIVRTKKGRLVIQS